MSALDDFLTSGISAANAYNANPTPIDNPNFTLGQMPDPTRNIASGGDLVVTAPRKTPDADPPKPFDYGSYYDNSQAIQAARQANANAPPVDGAANGGIWGLLPQGVQHGAVRNLLGSIGDAFLMHAGQQPWYQQRMEQRELGQAMAGAGTGPDPVASTRAAAERMAMTGVPGSDVAAQKLLENGNNLQLHQDQLQWQNNFHNAEIANQNARTFDRQFTLSSGQLRAISQMPHATPQQAQAQKDAYKRFYDAQTTQAQGVDKSKDANSAYGLPSPEVWTPESTQGFGMTANQSQVSDDKAEQRATSRRDTDVSAAARIAAARESASIKQYASPAQYQKYLVDKEAAYEAGRGPPLTADEARSLNQKEGIHNHRPGQDRGNPPQLQPGTSYKGFQVFDQAGAEAASRNPANKGKWWYTTDGRKLHF